MDILKSLYLGSEILHIQQLWISCLLKQQQKKLLILTGKNRMVCSAAGANFWTATIASLLCCYDNSWYSM